MNYEDMFLTMIGFMFVFNLLIVFYADALPDSPIISGQNYMDYSKADVNSDFETMISYNTASASGSDLFGNFTWLFTQASSAFNTVIKLFKQVFGGYYTLGSTIADAVEDKNLSSIPIHNLLEGIGTVMGIMMVFGLLIMIRNLVFKT
jgi:hypothetical protein